MVFQKKMHFAVLDKPKCSSQPSLRSRYDQHTYLLRGFSMKKLTTEQYLQKAKLLHGDKFDYTKTVYVTQHTKLSICCPIHGDFSTYPWSHLRDLYCGCVSCKKDIGSPNKITYHKFITKAKTKYKDLYDYSFVEYVDYMTPIKIICQYHGEVLMSPSSHLSSTTGCCVCSKQEMISKSVESKRKNKNIAIERCRKKYGVDWYCQTDEMHGKNYQMKSFIFPSGNVVNVMGYEPKALTVLLEAGFDENDIIVTGRKSIKYIFDGETKVYHPDIVLKSENKIIEVKSSYTFEKDLKLTHKAEGCKSAGFKFEVWIFDRESNNYSIVSF